MIKDAVLMFLVSMLFLTQGVLFYYALEFAFYIMGGSVVVFFFVVGAGELARRRELPKFTPGDLGASRPLSKKAERKALKKHFRDNSRLGF